MNDIRSTLATVWRIAAPYFRSEDKWMARGLLLAVIVIELAVVGLTVLFNRWNNTFYNALQEKNYDVFTYQIGYFCVLAAFWIALKVYQLYLNQWLQIRWRRWMTDRLSRRLAVATPTTTGCSCRATPPTTRTSASPKTPSCSSTAP